MNVVFLEIVIDADEATGRGLESRDEIEDPLEEALSSSGLGEVTGGGGGMGVYVIDVDVTEEKFDEGLRVVREVLKILSVPVGTKIKRNHPVKVEYAVYI